MPIAETLLPYGCSMLPLAKKSSLVPFIAPEKTQQTIPAIPPTKGFIPVVELGDDLVTVEALHA